MRLALLAACVFAAGTWIGGIAYGLIPTPGAMLHAVRTLVTDGATTIPINPIRAAYDKVAREVSVPRTPKSLGFQASKLPAMDFSNLRTPSALTIPDAQYSFDANIVAQSQQFNNRMEDLRNYGRNPAAWRGPPPH